MSETKQQTPFTRAALERQGLVLEQDKQQRKPTSSLPLRPLASHTQQQPAAPAQPDAKPRPGRRRTRQSAAPAPADTRSDPILAGLARDDAADMGLSSSCIAMHMSTGFAFAGVDYPRDADDFGRCVRLLDREAKKGWRERMSEMKKYGKQWAALAEHWPALEKQYKDGIADFLRAGGNANLSPKELHGQVFGSGPCERALSAEINRLIGGKGPGIYIDVFGGGVATSSFVGMPVTSDGDSSCIVS